MITEKIPSRSGFSSSRAFHPWSRIYRSPSGSLANWCFVGSYWTSNPAVQFTATWSNCCYTKPEWITWYILSVTWDSVTISCVTRVQTTIAIITHTIHQMILSKSFRPREGVSRSQNVSPATIVTWISQKTYTVTQLSALAGDLIAALNGHK